MTSFLPYLERVRNAGMTAGYNGTPYASNPYRRGTQEYAIWSEAHNGARANKMFKEDHP